MDVKVLVVETKKLFPDEIWEGFRTDESNEIFRRIEENKLFLRRGDVEDDPNFKQIIPQIVLKVGEKIFIHKVPQTGSESRLHDLWPIVLGGHVEESDLNLEQASLREFEEELDYLGKIIKKTFLGIVNLQDNPVNSVHLGLVWLFEGDSEKFNDNSDDGVSEGKFLTINEAEKYYDKMTFWSKLIFPKIKEVVEFSSGNTD